VHLWLWQIDTAHDNVIYEKRWLAALICCGTIHVIYNNASRIWKEKSKDQLRPLTSRFDVAWLHLQLASSLRPVHRCCYSFGILNSLLFLSAYLQTCNQQISPWINNQLLESERTSQGGVKKRVDIMDSWLLLNISNFCSNMK
jgi:hypothetical protein